MSNPNWALLPGDIVLTRGSSLLGGLIRWAERHASNSLARINHAAVCVGPPDIIVEADIRARQCSLWQYHGNDGIIVYRPTKLTAEQKAAIVADALLWIGKPYPVPQLVYFFIDNKVFGGAEVFRRLLPDNLAVCSRLVAIAYWKAGVSFGVKDPDPNDIDEFCLAHPDEYTMVYHQNVDV